jgi:hypothetical protein
MMSDDTILRGAVLIERISRMTDFVAQWMMSDDAILRGALLIQRIFQMNDVSALWMMPDDAIPHGPHPEEDYLPRPPS